MIDGQNDFDQTVKIDMRKYDIHKTATFQGDDYTTGCLLYYNYFNNYNIIIRFKETTSAWCLSKSNIIN